MNLKIFYLYNLNEKINVSRNSVKITCWVVRFSQIT